MGGTIERNVEKLNVKSTTPSLKKMKAFVILMRDRRLLLIKGKCLCEYHNW